ncbi:hypothetical protein QBC39DRAFT_362091 [Podospora conica]|nr:hypothetical protein QBC39DRAFT_362091 [Schizothecium conicum]
MDQNSYNILKFFQDEVIRLSSEWYYFEYNPHYTTTTRGIASSVAALLEDFEKYNLDLSQLPPESREAFVVLLTLASTCYRVQGDYRQAISIAEKAEIYLNQYKSEISKEAYSRILMSLYVNYRFNGNLVKAKTISDRYDEEIQEIPEDYESLTDIDETLAAISDVELSLSELVKGHFKDADVYLSRALPILQKAADLTQDKYAWPIWGTFYKVWTIIGLREETSPETAMATLDEMTDRLNRYRDTDERFTLDPVYQAYIYQLQGVVNEKLGKFQEAASNWQRALATYPRGKCLFWTNQVRVKLGEHYYIREKNYEAALEMFDEALKLFTGKPYYNGERARTLFLKAGVLNKTGDTGGANEAKEEAKDLLDVVLSNHDEEYRLNRDLEKKPLELEDFDQGVMIMSR